MGVPPGHRDARSRGLLINGIVAEPEQARRKRPGGRGVELPPRQEEDRKGRKRKATVIPVTNFPPRGRLSSEDPGSKSMRGGPGFHFILHETRKPESERKGASQ